MARIASKLPRRRFLRLRGGKVEVGFGLLLASMLQARAAQAAEADSNPGVLPHPDLNEEQLAALQPKLDAVEVLSPEELKALLDAATLAQLGIDAKQFHDLVDSDLKEAIRQLEAAFRKKLSVASNQKDAKVAAASDGAVAAKASHNEFEEAEEGSGLGGEISLLWLIGGIAAIGGVALAAGVFGGDDDEDDDEAPVNKAPVAANDAVSTAEDAPVTFDVRTNDTDANKDALSVTHINGTAITTTSPVAVTGGSISLAADGKLTFTPTANFNGTPSFTYTISDGKGGTATGTTNLTVTAVNDAPVNAAPATLAATQDAGVLVTGLSVSDVDGPATITTTLTVANGSLVVAALQGGATVAGSGTGTITLTGFIAQVNASLGAVTYTGTGGFSGNTTLTISTTDGIATDTDTVAVTVAKVFTGVVQDGYVSGAQVFIDANNNGKFDEGEPTGTTDAKGAFSVASNVVGPIIAIGGTNIDTGLPNTVTLKAPAGSTVINPITTMVAAAVAAGKTVAEATASVNASLGLPAGTDLTNFDILNPAVDPATALAAQKAAVQIVTILQAASTAAGAAGAEAAQAAIMTQLGAMAAAGTPVALGNIDAVAALLAVVPGVDPAALQAAAVKTAAINQTVAAATSLGEIVTTQVEVSKPNANLAPAGTNDVAGAHIGDTVIIDVLANDRDPEGQKLSILSINGVAITGGAVHLQGGVVSVNADGKVVFTAAPGFVGTQAFTYAVSDGVNSTTASATVNVTPEGPVLAVSSDHLSAVIANSANLGAAGVSTIDMVGDLAAITDGQAGALVSAGLDFADGDLVTVEAEGTHLNTSLKGLQDLKIDTIAVSGMAGMLSVDAGAGGLGGLSASGLPQFDPVLDVTLNVESGALDPALDLSALASALGAAGIDHIGVKGDGSFKLTADQAGALSDGGISMTDGANVTMTATSANLAELDAEIAATLDGVNIDHLDLTDDVGTITDAQAGLLAEAGVDFADSDTITVEAEGTHLNTSLKTLQDLKVDSIAVSGMAGMLSVDAGSGGLGALSASGLPQFDVAQSDEELEVILNVDGGLLDPSLDVAALAAGLAAAGVDKIDVAGSLSLNSIQAAGIAGAGLSFTSASDVTITAANVQAIDVAVAAAIGADHIDVDDDYASISDAEASLLVAQGIDFADADIVTVEAAGTHLSTSLRDLNTLGVDVVDASGHSSLTLDAGDLSGVAALGLPQFDDAQADGDLTVTLRVDVDALAELERLADALRDAGIDNFAMAESLDSFDSDTQDLMAAITATSGIEFVYDADPAASPETGATGEAASLSIQQVYRELLETFEANEQAQEGDTEIADGTASALMEAGMLRAFLSDNLILDASSSGDRLLTTLKEISELGFDQVRLSDTTDATVYVDFGTDAAAVGEIQALFSNLDLNSTPASSLFPDAAHMALVVDSETAQALSSMEGAFEKLAGLGFDELDILLDGSSASVVTTDAMEVKLIGQDDDLYGYLHNNQ